jgi:Spy/CpxP family protein refolding chaperone
MNRLSKIAVLGPLLAAAVFAQRPFGALASGSPPDPATIVQHKVDRLTTLLGLTSAQATQATTIFTAAETAMTPIETSLASYHTSIETAVKSNDTAAIDQLSASIGSATGQITAIRNKADAAFYAILTADQQTKLNALPGGGRGPGGPGPGFRMRGGPLN